MRDIGKNIKTIRQAKNITQEALAEMLHVTRQTVSNYENGRSRPDLDMLIKISEVLETDANTVLYGPALPQDKQAARKWALLCVCLLTAAWTVYFLIQAVFHTPQDVYVQAARSINQITVLPAAMFLLGWSLLHFLSLFSSLRQIKSPKVNSVRIALMILGCVLAAIPVPYSIWYTAAFLRSVTDGSVSMFFPNIPVYRQIYTCVYLMDRHAPFIYSILGGLFWLFGLPHTCKKANAE